MDEKVLELLAKNSQAVEMLAALYAKEQGMTYKAPATVNEAPLLFGTSGLFSTPGLEPDIITAYVRPHGLEMVLPKLPSVTESPIFGSITGIDTAAAAAPATNPCDDNPTGFIKGCELTAQFGRLAFDTNTIEFDKVMLQVNRGVTTDLTLRGQLLGINSQEIQPGGLSDADVLNIVTGSEMVKVGMLFQRGTATSMGLNRQIWQGAIANNTAGGGYKEFPGLDAQIATGQVDATSNTACPALDSDVKDFNYNVVGGSGLDIVEYLSMLEFYLFYNAEKMGLTPVEWVVVMRPELWQELTAVWPIAYNTNRGASVLSGNTRMIVDGGDMIAERDRMRRSMTIDINGRTHRVVTDTGIAEGTNVNNANVPAGSFSSSIYMVPLTITGGFPVTYMEYVDYRRGSADIAKLMGRNDFWTDRGIYSWALEQTKWCYKLSAKTEMRVVLRSPQLAGRIDNVLYSPLQHLRESVPGSAYEFDGGVSIRNADTTYAIWK